jgi:hypothetical protein
MDPYNRALITLESMAEAGNKIATACHKKACFLTKWAGYFNKKGYQPNGKVIKHDHADAKISILTRDCTYV